MSSPPIKGPGYKTESYPALIGVQ
uniref:Uncharacterized protein n=1 Tax=Anguilla anguilla TaxID=7936 RepID=A0A0E9RR58_ANGAN